MKAKKLTQTMLKSLIVEEVEKESEKSQNIKRSKKHDDAKRIRSILLQVISHPNAEGLSNDIEDIVVSPSDNILVNLAPDVARNETDRALAARIQATLPLMRLQRKWFIAPHAYSDDKKEEFLTISSV